ncbi:hypothetical protein [Spirosoma sp. KUDC1026]|uniref:hypothetical protein n=1 Tax=Spirosoma sp. KUDC1026 TaxID=2745947 RepID=UPI00159BE3E8|nr:hypothetical protein [Spirosoma sp. KUDC1026]QKZ15166.1 hypothetical protein HU175_22095 [Spirosoma sp. KUDC1026]
MTHAPHMPAHRPTEGVGATRYEMFFAAFQRNPDRYREEMAENGTFYYNEQVNQLIRLSNSINHRMLVYLFGERLGAHFAERYVNADRNLLTFFSLLDENYQLFLLHELKTNDALFAHC